MALINTSKAREKIILNPKEIANKYNCMQSNANNLLDYYPLDLEKWDLKLSSNLSIFKYGDLEKY